MNVTTISATIRYSAEAKGAWRTIELGAEATLDPGEDWQTAQQKMYSQLGEQFKTIWSKGASKACPELGRRVQQAEPDSWEELGGNHREPLKPVPSHYCQQHQAEFKRYEKNGRSWYSHKAPDSTWCKET
jgi:hypothetical protein